MTVEEMTVEVNKIILQVTNLKDRLAVAEEAISKARQLTKQYNAGEWNYHYRALALTVLDAHDKLLELRNNNGKFAAFGEAIEPNNG